MTPLQITIARLEHAEARVRSALLLIATLFVLVALFQFGQLDHSWGVVRHALAQRAELYFECERLAPGATKPEACSRLEEMLGEDEITAEVMRRYVDGRLFLKQDAVDARQKQQDIYFQNVLRFSIPPLGVSVDSREMAVVGTVGFSVLLAWLAICLSSQSRAWMGVLALIPRENETRADWLLASGIVGQSLFGTVPSGDPAARSIARVLHGLIVAPFLLMLWILVYSFQTGVFFDTVVPRQVSLTLELGTVGTILLGSVTGVVLNQLWRMPPPSQPDWPEENSPVLALPPSTDVAPLT